MRQLKTAVLISIDSHLFVFLESVVDPLYPRVMASKGSRMVRVQLSR
jgi:hypothetical protein